MSSGQDILKLTFHICYTNRIQIYNDVHKKVLNHQKEIALILDLA